MWVISTLYADMGQLKRKIKSLYFAVKWYSSGTPTKLANGIYYDVSHARSHI